VIVVFGSVNLDLVARVPRLPRAGETLAGLAFQTSAGGKGANQALAARRAGSEVTLVGAVGADAFAAPALQCLEQDGVRLHVATDADQSTGVALIHVDDAGENAITVIAGANATLRSDRVPDVWLGASTTLVMQLEVPHAECLRLAQRARVRGARVVLNAAPASELDRDWLDALDVLVVNEHECKRVAAGFDAPSDPRSFASTLARRHGLLACVTLGSAGVLATDRQGLHRVPALRVDVVDTVGAGDAFVGVLAAALDAGASTRLALARAAAAGSLACTRRGAQPAMPSAAEIDGHATTLESGMVTEPLAS
jgi:ribokinase